MASLINSLSAWNGRMNDIPRKLLLILAVIACAVLCWVALPYTLPFVLALLFAMLIEPLVRRMRGAMKAVKIGRKTIDLSHGLPTVIGMLILFGPIFFVLTLLTRQLFREAVDLAKQLPALVDWLEETVKALSEKLAGTPEAPGPLPVGIINAINEWLANIDETVSKVTNELISTGGPLAVRTAYNTVAGIPRVLLFIVLCIMGTYQMSSDKTRVQGFFKHTLPGNLIVRGKALYSSIFQALFGQVRAQLKISALVMVVVTLGLVVLNVPSSLLLGIFIGLADALPVIGAGLFLISGSLLFLLQGNVFVGVGMLVLYLLVIVTRQIAEPRIVGKSLGLHPLLTMMSIYAGYISMGFLGMLAGPLLANICKVVLAADAKAHAERPPLEQSGGSADT